MSTPSRCSACGEAIWWRLTAAGTRIPIDPHPAAAGTIVLADHRARVLTGDELPAQQTAYADHRVTCVKSPAHARRLAAQITRCLACGLPMDPWLPAHGWRHHVCCAPPSRAELEAAMASRAT